MSEVVRAKASVPCHASRLSKSSWAYVEGLAPAPPPSRRILLFDRAEHFEAMDARHGGGLPRACACIGDIRRLVVLGRDGMRVFELSRLSLAFVNGIIYWPYLQENDDNRHDFSKA